MILIIPEIANTATPSTIRSTTRQMKKLVKSSLARLIRDIPIPVKARITPIKPRIQQVIHPPLLIQSDNDLENPLIIFIFSLVFPE